MVETNLTSVHEDVGSVPDLTQWVRELVAMDSGVVHRRGLDLALLWLWSRSAATVPIRPLAWEPPYAAGAAQEMAKKQKKKNKKQKNKTKHTDRTVNIYK